MFKLLLFYFCKSVAGWSIRIDGKILPSWTHADRYILEAAAKREFSSPEYKTVEVIPVRIFSVL